MEILTTTLEQMTVLLLLIFLGYILAKLKTVPENSATVLSKMENNLLSCITIPVIFCLLTQVM